MATLEAETLRKAEALQRVSETLKAVMRAIRLAEGRITSRTANELAAQAQRALMQEGPWP